MIRIKLKPARRDPWMWQGSYPAFCPQYLLTVLHQIEIFWHRPWNRRLKAWILSKNKKTPVKSTKMSKTWFELMKLGLFVWKGLINWTGIIFNDKNFNIPTLGLTLSWLWGHNTVDFGVNLSNNCTKMLFF